MFGFCAKHPVESLVIICKGKIESHSPQWEERDPQYFADLFHCAASHKQVALGEHASSYWEAFPIGDDSQIVGKQNDPLSSGGLYLELELHRRRPIPFGGILDALSEALAQLGTVSLSRLSFHLPNLDFPDNLNFVEPETPNGRGPLNSPALIPIQVAIMSAQTDVILPFDAIEENLANCHSKNFIYEGLGRANLFRSYPLLLPERLNFSCRWTPQGLGELCNELIGTLHREKYQGGLHIYFDKMQFAHVG